MKMFLRQHLPFRWPDRAIQSCQGSRQILNTWSIYFLVTHFVHFWQQNGWRGCQSTRTMLVYSRAIFCAFGCPCKGWGWPLRILGNQNDSEGLESLSWKHLLSMFKDLVPCPAPHKPNNKKQGRVTLRKILSFACQIIWGTRGIFRRKSVLSCSSLGLNFIDASSKSIALSHDLTLLCFRLLSSKMEIIKAPPSEDCSE